MAKFGLKSKREKQIEQLDEEIEREREKYDREAKKLNVEIDKKVRDYNDQIPIINNIRNNKFGIQIDKLYDFLTVFGEVGIEISPFDFKTEKSRLNREHTMSGTDDIPDGREDMFSNFKEKGVAGSTISSMGKSALFTFSAFSYVTIPMSVVAPLASSWIVNQIKDNISNKEKITELNTELEGIKIAFKNELIMRQQYIETMKDAIQIAEIYRVNLQSISRSIEETILPELGFVKSFLIAEDVKNKLLSDEEIIEVKPEAITLYKYTPYHKHYLLVQNSFHFYKIIVEFFSKPILTNLLADNAISTQEKEAFNEQVEQIKGKLEQVKQTRLISEVAHGQS